MQFNLDPNEQANEVIFSGKSGSANVFHPLINFNNNSIAKSFSQKHLGIMLIQNFNALVDEEI